MNGTVVYMTDPEARYVSLVKRGANRTPFRIVKEQKETGMKIIQRIVAKKGTDVAAIKSAVGDEAANALNLSEPKDAGGFTLYDQHPEDAFKADTVQVVSLSDDNSIICLCGEMVEKSEGFVSKLLAKKSETKGVEVPDSMQPMDAEVLKATLADSVYFELDAMGNGIHNILCQSEGKPSDKVKMCRSLCDNFIACLETAISTMKSDEFVLAKPELAEKAEPEAAEKSEAVEEKAEPAQPEQEEADKADASDKQTDAVVENFLAKLDEVAKAQQEALEKLHKEMADAQNAALEKLNKGISELDARVSKMEKAPATVVSSHEDSGKEEGVAKSQKSENVFAGLFGDLHR